MATYPFPGAYAAIEAVAAAPGSRRIALPRGGLGVVSASHPDSVHVAYPGIDYQVEVYVPRLGAALRLVSGGRLAAVCDLAPARHLGAQPVTAAGTVTGGR